MTNKYNLKIVTINLDYTLAMDAPKFGDAQQRNIDYGKYVDKIISITHTPRRMKLTNKKLSDHVEIFPTSSIHPIFFLFDALRIARHIFKNDKIDLVLAQDPFITGLVGFLIKKKYKCKFLIHFHGDFWQNEYWLREKWYHFILLGLSKFLVKRADGVRVVSSGIKEKLINAGIKANKIRVIPTPVDLRKFENYDYDRIKEFKESLLGNKKVIINVGRKDPSKGYQTLFKTIPLVYEKYRNLAFWQVGANLKLKEKIRGDENLLLLSIGMTGQKELTNYYHASDVYVSSSKHESLGKVLIEAMACGLPIVATATTGSREIIENEVSGFLVPIGDTAALARKIVYLLNNPEIAKKMGEAGQQTVKEKFNYDELVEKTVKFWHDLTKPTL